MQQTTQAIVETIRVIFEPRYAAQQAQVAGQSRAVWRMFAGLALVLFISYLGSGLVYGLARRFGADPATLQLGTTPIAMLILLFSFVFASIGVVLAMSLLQRRPVAELFGPVPLFFRQFRNTVAALILLWGVVTVLPPYDLGAPLTANLTLGAWLRWLPLAVLAVLVQVEAEELLFRGYLQQALAARFRSGWIWMGAPSVIFALGHYLPAEAGENAIWVALWAGLFAVLMADLTARAGSLGPAVAVHFVNNAVALLIVGAPEGLNGLALFLSPYTLSDTAEIRPWLWVDFAMMLVSWLAARLAIRA